MGAKNILILLTLALFCIFAIGESKLVYLLDVSRHGAKYPSKNMITTTDPSSLKGQLTGVGQRQQYLLGSYLYHDYVLG